MAIIINQCFTFSHFFYVYFLWNKERTKVKFNLFIIRFWLLGVYKLFFHQNLFSFFLDLRDSKSIHRE